MTLDDFGKEGLFLSKRPNLKDEKKLLKLDYSYTYWVYNLLEKVARIFQWEGLPCEQIQLELRVLADGYVGFVNDEYTGLSVVRGTFNGITEYSDLPLISRYTNFMYANAIMKGGNPVINKEATICYNTALRTSILPMVKRYASLLAHSELSVKCAIVSLRENEVFAVEDDKTANEVRRYHQKIYEGEPDVIIDKSLIGSIQDLSKSQGTQATSSVLQAWDIRLEILRSFFNEIGVRFARDKRERMVTDEVDSDAQMLLLNVNDMLKCREQFVKETNNLFGTNISVKLSPEFELINNAPQREDGEQNDN